MCLRGFIRFGSNVVFFSGIVDMGSGYFLGVVLGSMVRGVVFSISFIRY